MADDIRGTEGDELSLGVRQWPRRSQGQVEACIQFSHFSSPELQIGLPHIAGFEGAAELKGRSAAAVTAAVQ